MAQYGFACAAACAAATAALSWPVAPAMAAGPDPLATASWAPSAVRLQPDSAAQVSGRYRCIGGSATKDLWVSVKQGPGSGGLDGPGAQDPAAWYDLRDAEATAGLSAVCDGAWHPSRVTVESRFGALKAGDAVVQWCLSDRTPYELNAQGFAFACQAASVPAR
jgi:hypothetical protein